MNKSTRNPVFFIGIFTLMLFTLSCSNDEISNYSIDQQQAASVSGDRTQASQPNPNQRSLYIDNKSDYKYAINLIGGQTNFAVHDDFEVLHKNYPSMILNPGQKVTFYDYLTVSDANFQIFEWYVLNHALPNNFVGEFTSVKMSELYGPLIQPNNPASLRYPVWKYLDGTVFTPQNVALPVVIGNNLAAVSPYNLGSVERGYHSEINYGNAPSGLALVTVKWRQSNGDLRSGGEVRVTIQNAHP